MSQSNDEIARLRAEIARMRREIDTILAEPRRPLGPRLRGGGSGNIDPGEYQYMYYGMVTDNQNGYDFIRAHPVGPAGTTSTTSSGGGTGYGGGEEGY